MTFVYAIAFRDDAFVMVKNRVRGWEMPGGAVDPGEAPEEAVVREFGEETGMGFEPVASLNVPGGAVFFGFVDDEITDGRPQEPHASDEISDIEFFRELPDNLSFPRSEYELMLQEARNELKKYINRNSIGDSCAT